MPENMPPENDPIESAHCRFINEIPEGLMPSETIPLLAAKDRILTSDLNTHIDDPPYCRAIVEGYVVCFSDLAKPIDSSGLELEIAGEIAVGDESTSGLIPGKALAVTTGSYIPSGDYAVLRAWDVEKTGERIIVRKGAKSGAFIETQGEIRAQGTSLFKKGRVITSGDIFLSASQGITELPVSCKPKVALFSSGNEVIPATAPARTGSIWDCNQYGLSSLIDAAGGIPLFQGIIKDDFELFKSQLKAALDECDMAVISGGTVAENRNFTADLLDTLGPPGALVKGIPMRSGKPIVLGLSGIKPIVCVAGHPPEAARGFTLFGQAAIARLMGKRE